MKIVKMSTKMKSLPRPWYLTKCRNPLSLRSRKEVSDSLSSDSKLMEVAEAWNLGFLGGAVFNPRKLGWTEEEKEREEEGEKLRKLWERKLRAGEVWGREMLAAMAMAQRFLLSSSLLSVYFNSKRRGW